MSKVGGALPAWYWPEGIPRRSPVAHQTIDRLIKRACSRSTEESAIVWPDRVLSYGELLETVIAFGQAITGLCPGDDVLAVAEADPGEAYVLMLSALAAGKRVLVAEMTASDAELAKQLSDAGACCVLSATGAGAAGRSADMHVVQREQLSGYDGQRAKLRPTKATDPAVIIPADGELAVHSQYSIAAMAVSLLAFIPQLREMTLVAPPPLSRWESLAVMTAALTSAAPIAVSSLADLSNSGSVDVTGAYAVMLRRQADELIQAKRAPGILRSLAYLFVSTGHFRPRWRRELESLCGRAVLPIWGTAPLGPAVAAHPTWFPLDAHGIPLVNVRVVPIDPASGEVSVVPWEMLERAEIGVDSPAAMTRFVREGADAELRSGKFLRTFVGGSVDHVGVVVLHRPPKHSVGGRP